MKTPPPKPRNPIARVVKRITPKVIPDKRKSERERVSKETIKDKE